MFLVGDLPVWKFLVNSERIGINCIPVSGDQLMIHECFLALFYERF